MTYISEVLSIPRNYSIKFSSAFEGLTIEKANAQPDFEPVEAQHLGKLSLDSSGKQKLNRPHVSYRSPPLEEMQSWYLDHTWPGPSRWRLAELCVAPW